MLVLLLPPPRRGTCEEVVVNELRPAIELGTEYGSGWGAGERFYSALAPHSTGIAHDEGGEAKIWHGEWGEVGGTF